MIDHNWLEEFFSEVDSINILWNFTNGPLSGSTHSTNPSTSASTFMTKPPQIRGLPGALMKNRKHSETTVV